MQFVSSFVLSSPTLTNRIQHRKRDSPKENQIRDVNGEANLEEDIPCLVFYEGVWRKNIRILKEATFLKIS